MKKLNVLAVLLIVLSSVIASCAGKIKVLDKEACADLGVAGARCAHLFTINRRDVPKPQWDQDRVGWVCMRGDDFSDTQDELDKLCRTTKLCDYATKKNIEQLRKNMAPLIEGGKSAKASAARKR